MQNLYVSFVHGKREFKYWLAETEPITEYFIEAFYQEFGERLDYSPESLLVLERGILEKYSGPELISERYVTTWGEDAGRYIGEVFRKELNGYWDLIYRESSHNNGYFRVPIVRFDDSGRSTCPRYTASATIDRRKGDYIYKIFRNIREDVTGKW